MARVAIVTGGTRGIGAAISTALKDAGYVVAATYGGNDEAAARFKERTGIATYRWDVSDFAACQAGARSTTGTFKRCCTSSSATTAPPQLEPTTT